MKAERSYPKFIITAKGTRWVEQGHPWIYEGEVLREEGQCENGGLADAVSEKGKYLGTGFVSRQSKIRLRLLSRNANDRFDEAFWQRRIQYAWDYRKTVMGDDFRASRLIFGEADQFPGLTVDLFEDVLVVQTLSLGTEKVKDLLLDTLCGMLPEYGVNVRAVYERNDVNIRTLEGMETFTGYWKPENFPDKPEGDHVIITENGIRYDVDYVNGQKTGFFLDQKYNREAIRKLCKGAKVLDCFTHTGSFALNAGQAGAKSVLGLDASELAVEQARKNAELNGLSDTVHFECADVFDKLPEFEEAGEKFDVVILDPPAFTKSRNSIKNAVKGYREINLRAMKLVKDGGFLATCSCSHFMDYDLFTKTIAQAASNVHKRLRQVEFRTQAPDHPILWAANESYYLKFYIFQVCDDK